MNQRLKPFVLSLSKHEWFKSLLTDFSVHPSTGSGRTEKSCFNQYILLIDIINSSLNDRNVGTTDSQTYAYKKPEN